MKANMKESSYYNEHNRQNIIEINKENSNGIVDWSK